MTLLYIIPIIWWLKTSLTSSTTKCTYCNQLKLGKELVPSRETRIDTPICFDCYEIQLDEEEEQLEKEVVLMTKTTNVKDT